jgi:hypothetical protein
MSDLTARLLRACTLGPGFKTGVTGVTGVTKPTVTPNFPSDYNRYAGYAPATPGSECRPIGVSQHVTNAPRQGCDPADWRAYFDRRASHYEHGANIRRVEAEQLALNDAIQQWVSGNPAPASHPRSGCVHCGLGDNPSDRLLPALTLDGHTWVHDQCWEDWRAERRRAAEVSLRDLGVP